jgi:hypothetical protein
MPCPGSTTCARMLEKTMTLPLPRFTMPGTNAFSARKMPFRFNPTTRSNSSSV